MSQDYPRRVAVVLVVLFGSLALIFSPVLEKLFHPKEHITNWVNLKPGIDMVGGTSLVYQIKAPEGKAFDPELATKVSVALKRHVDPQGVRNLIWRPEGADRLEIQMPNSGGNGEEARAKQDQLLAAEQQLQQTNLSLSEVTDAVEQKNGRSRLTSRSSRPAAKPGSICSSGWLRPTTRSKRCTRSQWHSATLPKKPGSSRNIASSRRRSRGLMLTFPGFGMISKINPPGRFRCRSQDVQRRLPISIDRNRSIRRSIRRLRKSPWHIGRHD